MGFVIGVDPGSNGALATYDRRTRTIMSIEDMPIVTVKVNKTKRKRLDVVSLFDYLDTQKMLGCEMVMIERVGARKGEGAAGAFAFGMGYGILIGLCVALRIPYDTVPPAKWKKAMGVDGKVIATMTKKEAESAIVSRADELMPNSAPMFRGPRGGFNLDRAEACMIAKYCGDNVQTPEFSHLIDAE